ncbi:hypothetical protein ACFLYR_07200 [Chloroflexota bacterium]
MAATRQSRTVLQLQRALQQTDTKKFEMLISRVWRLTFEAIIGELGECRTLEERTAALQVISRRLGVTQGQLISQMVEINNKLRTDTLLRKVIETTPDRHMGDRTSRSKDQE